MNIVIIGANETEKKICQDTFSSIYDSALLNFFAVSDSIQEYITQKTPDLIITFNLAGFSLKTLTGNIWYNILPCCQIHIVSNLENTSLSLLSRPLSISMFFCATTDDAYTLLLKANKDIPYLKKLSLENNASVSSLRSLFQTIWNEYHPN